MIELRPRLFPAFGRSVLCFANGFLYLQMCICFSQNARTWMRPFAEQVNHQLFQKNNCRTL